MQKKNERTPHYSMQNETGDRILVDAAARKCHFWLLEIFFCHVLVIPDIATGEVAGGGVSSHDFIE